MDMDNVVEKNNHNAIYRIRDAEGRLVALHRRLGDGNGKQIWWQLPDGTMGLNGTPLADLPLYGSEQVSGWDEDELVVVVEGEKARDALDRTGYFNALGTVTGAGGTPGKEALEILRGREVVLWPDNDAAGRAHIERIAEKLQGVAAAVRVFTWHDAPEKGDAADHPAVISGDKRALDRLLNDLMCAPE